MKNGSCFLSCAPFIYKISGLIHVTGLSLSCIAIAIEFCSAICGNKLFGDSCITETQVWCH